MFVDATQWWKVAEREGFIAAGTVSIDGVAYPASGRMIPTYQIYGYGDLAFLEGTV